MVNRVCGDTDIRYIYLTSILKTELEYATQYYYYNNTMIVVY